jgi:hypothetical protein
MPGYTDKSQQYLRLAIENYKRAGAAESPELKARFTEIAAHYRDLGNAEIIRSPLRTAPIRRPHLRSGGFHGGRAQLGGFGRSAQFRFAPRRFCSPTSYNLSTADCAI